MFGSFLEKDECNLEEEKRFIVVNGVLRIVEG